MADSAEDKKQPQTDPQNPSGITTLTIANQYGAIREMQKDSKGRFLAKKKPLIPTIEYVRARRKRLAKVREGTGRFDGMTESMAIMEELLEIVHMEIATDSKTGLPDSKHMSAKVKAAELLHLITEGKPAPSEQELDKLERQPVTAIFVQAPQIMNPEVVDADKQKEKSTQPSFAEVTGITTNPKK